MRILWFVNIPIHEFDQTAESKLRTSGGWIVSLLEHLRSTTDHQIAVVTAWPVNEMKHYTVDGVDFYIIPSRKNPGKSNLQRSLEICLEVVSSWKPDILHIHGTERFFGLLSARNMTAVPTVVSIQGLLDPYAQWYHYFGNRTLLDIISMHRVIEPLLKRGQIWSYWNLRQAARMEREIIAGNQYFFGRTLWDRSHVLGMNHNATYYHVGETLRSPFWKTRWDLEKCRPHRIMFSNAGHPRKGTEILIEAVRYLKRDFPDIQICIAGKISRRSGYGRYLRNKINELESVVMELGGLNADEMIAELVKSHVFISPSFIDNSPNAVCEAQLLGMPVIASYTGGIPSLITEGCDGLFFPNGDPRVLASRVREIFEDNNLAITIGGNANTTAAKRHNPDIIVRQLLKGYTCVMEENENTI